MTYVIQLWFLLHFIFMALAVLTRIEVLKKLGSGSISASSLKIIRNFLQILSIKLISICKQFNILSLRYQSVPDHVTFRREIFWELSYDPSQSAQTLYLRAAAAYVGWAFPQKSPAVSVVQRHGSELQELLWEQVALACQQLCRL